MVRSDWLRSLIVVLATTGLVWGQQAPAQPGPTPGAEEKTITVQEAGKAPQKCKVLRAWQTAAGTMAYEVKALDTGEVMTLEESGPAAPPVAAPAGSHLKALATRIFHWGKNGTPPDGTPMPPGEMVQYAGPVPGAGHLQPTPYSGLPVVVNQPVPPPPPVTLPVVVSGTEEVPAARPPLGSRVRDAASRLLHRDRTQEVVDGGTVIMPAAASAGTPVVQAGPSPARSGPAWPPALADQPVVVAAPAAAPLVAVPASQPVMASPAPMVTTTVPAGPPCPYCPGPTPVPAGQPAMVRPAPVVTTIVPAGPPCPYCPGPTPVPAHATVVEMPAVTEVAPPKSTTGLLPRLSSLVKKEPSLPGTVVSTTEPPPAVAGITPPAKTDDPTKKPAYLADAELPPKPAKPAVEPAKPGDWRQSWGKLDKPDTSKVQVAQASPLKNTDAPAPPPPFMATVPPAPPAPQPTRPALPKAEAKRADPLKDPGTYSRLPADQKPATKKEAQDKAVARKDEAKSAPPPLPTPTAPLADNRAGVPLGARSVVDAGSPKYMPVPIVTLPDYRNPQPPAPQMPKPPEPNYADVNNAFTNPAATPSPATPPQAGNAFSPPPDAAQPPVPSGAFANMPPGYPGGMPGMMPPGYAGYGYGRPGMYPPAAMARAMYQPMPGPAMNQAVYQPNPMMGQAVRPAGYLPQAAPAQAVVPGMPVARQEVPLVGGSMSPAEAVATLHDSLYPSQREWAAMRLGGLDWRTNGEAVQALVVAARQDPAPSVRAACVRTLGHMRVNTLPVVSTIQALKTDGDPRVLHEVEEALAVLAPEPAAAAGPGIQRASAVMPAPR